ncbi:MAG: ABC transporter permease [Candidatus Bathyarchaeota archaeon]|nr:ABC transporter permease [Candidatus Termiticorpusculum sp.]
MSCLVIVKKELRDAFKTKTIWLAVAIFILTSSCYFYTATRNVEAASGFLEYFALYGLTPFSLSLPAILSMTTFGGEKAQGKIEMLLTTPITPKALWFGKTLTLTFITYLPIVTIFLVSLSTMLIGLSMAVFVSLLTLLHVFVILPMLCFATIGLIGLVHLASSKAGLGFAVGMILMVVAINVGIAMAFLFPGLLQYYSALFAALTVMLVLLNVGYLRRLKREQIVLSR